MTSISSNLINSSLQSCPSLDIFNDSNSKLISQLGEACTNFVSYQSFQNRSNPDLYGKVTELIPYALVTGALIIGVVFMRYLNNSQSKQQKDFEAKFNELTGKLTSFIDHVLSQEEKDPKYLEITGLLSGVVNSHTASIKKSDSVLGTLEEKITELEAKNEALEKKVTSAQALLTKLEGNGNSFADKIRGLTGTMGELSETQDVLSQSVLQLKEKGTSHESSCRELKDSIDQSQGNVGVLNSLVERQERSIIDIDQHNKEVMDRVLKLEERNGELMGRLGKLEVQKKSDETSNHSILNSDEEEEC